MSLPIIEKVLYNNEEKAFQYKLTVSEFKETVYINIRKYFLSFDGEYVASTEGATFPLTLESLTQLMDGLFEILSQAEADEAITNYLKSKHSSGL